MSVAGQNVTRVPRRRRARAGRRAGARRRAREHRAGDAERLSDDGRSSRASGSTTRAACGACSSNYHTPRRHVDLARRALLGVRDQGRHDAAAGAVDPGHHARSRSQARPAASTISSRGATSCRSPIASAGPAEHVERAQERGQRDPHLELVAVDRRQLDAEHRRDVEVDRRAGTSRQRRTASRARVDLVRLDRLRVLELRADVVAVLGRARRERRAVRLGRLVEEERPRVVGRLGDLRLDDARAELPRAARRTARPRGSRGSAGPPTDGGLVSRPTVSPARRGSGTGAAGEHRPHERDVGDASCAIGPTVSKRRAEREDAVDRDAAPARLQADDAAARRGQPDRAAGVGAEAEVAEPGGERRGVAARRAAGRAARVRAGSGPCRTTGSGSSRPRRTRAGSPCRRRPRRRRRAARPPARCASGTWSA